MGKIKGILKKVTGTLKIATACLPLVSVFGGILGSVGLLIGTAASAKVMQRDFKQEQYYIERRVEDTEIIENQFSSGEIDKVEYVQKLDHLSSDEYIVETIREGGENTTEFQGRLKSLQQCKIALISVASIGAAGFIACGIAYWGHDYIEDLFDSGKDDFKYKASNDPPKLKKPKKSKKKYEPDAQRGEPLKETSNKVDDDGFESEDEEYEDVEAFYDRFHGNN